MFAAWLKALKASRRDMLRCASSSIAISGTHSIFKKNVAELIGCSNSMSEKDKPYNIYEVKSDESTFDPSLVHIEIAEFVDAISLSDSLTSDTVEEGTLWLGEHHNSANDHDLQVSLIRSIRKRRRSAPLAIGLEQVQIQFQSALNRYIEGAITLDEMRKQVEWDQRWSWPFEVYKPVFLLAAELLIPLIALNVNSEDLAAVEEGGFPGMSRSTLRKYIKDPEGFGNFSRQEAYKEYVNYVIQPSYVLHQRMGLLKSTISGQILETDMTFKNFLSGRMLWDEGMANAAYRWNRQNPGGLMICLVGADHAKFQLGITGRYSRLAKGSFLCKSVLLNPTLIDTRPSGSVADFSNGSSSQHPDRLTLQLQYRENATNYGVLPVADYIALIEPCPRDG